MLMIGYISVAPLFVFETFKGTGPLQEQKGWQTHSPAHCSFLRSLLSITHLLLLDMFAQLTAAILFDGREASHHSALIHGGELLNEHVWRAWVNDCQQQQ